MLGSCAAVATAGKVPWGGAGCMHAQSPRPPHRRLRFALAICCCGRTTGLLGITSIRRQPVCVERNSELSALHGVCMRMADKHCASDIMWAALQY